MLGNNMFEHFYGSLPKETKMTEKDPKEKQKEVPYPRGTEDGNQTDSGGGRKRPN